MIKNIVTFIFGKGNGASEFYLEEHIFKGDVDPWFIMKELNPKPRPPQPPLETDEIKISPPTNFRKSEVGIFAKRH